MDNIACQEIDETIAKGIVAARRRLKPVTINGRDGYTALCSSGTDGDAYAEGYIRAGGIRIESKYNLRQFWIPIDVAVAPCETDDVRA